MREENFIFPLNQQEIWMEKEKSRRKDEKAAEKWGKILFMNIFSLLRQLAVESFEVHWKSPRTWKSFVFLVLQLEIHSNWKKLFRQESSSVVEFSAFSFAMQKEKLLKEVIQDG